MAGYHQSRILVDIFLTYVCRLRSANNRIKRTYSGGLQRRSGRERLLPQRFLPGVT